MQMRDAAFVRDLVNQPAWLRFIGDRGVRTLADARSYIRTGPWAMYAQRGHGLCLVLHETSAQPLGICGLMKRDYLDDVDLGFAFASQHWGQGYAAEAARAVLHDAKQRLGIGRVLATTTPDNHASQAVLQRLGFQFVQHMASPDAGRALHLYGLNL